MTTTFTRRRALGLAGAGVAGLAATTVAGCGSQSADPLERARAGGAVLIGLSGERPFGFTDASGRATGESPEVARAVVAGLGGGGLVAVQVAYSELIRGLLAGQFDLIAIGLSITPLRCQQVAFSRPDFVAQTALLVPSGNPRGLATLGGVARIGATLGVLVDGAEQGYARAAGVRDARVTAFDGQSALVRGVSEGRVDCAALTRISLLDEVRRAATTAVEVTAGFYPIVDGQRALDAGGFAFRPQDTAFRAAFDESLTGLQSSGRWLDLVRPFGFGTENLPPPELTTERLCARTPTS